MPTIDDPWTHSPPLRAVRDDPPTDTERQIGPIRLISLANVGELQAPRISGRSALPVFAGQLAAMVGEGESGKTWLAVHCALDVAASGQAVLVVDGEMSAPTWRRRMTSLGADDDLLSRIYYTEMGDRSADVPVIRSAVADVAAQLVIWDSALSLISRNARSENDNAEVSRVYDRLREIVRDGPAGLIVDHSTKGGATLTSRGASAKFNALDLSYGVRLADGSIPGPLADWSSIVSVEKDRHGLLGDRPDREATFVPLGRGALQIEMVELGGASHRLSATNPVTVVVAQIAALDPPPTSASDAYRRLGGRKQVVLAAHRTWVEASVPGVVPGSALKGGNRGTGTTPVPGTGSHAGTDLYGGKT